MQFLEPVDRRSHVAQVDSESSSVDDACLVEALRDGDDAATGEFVSRLYPRMFAAAMKLLGKESDALDAVQDAFVSAISRIDQFRGDASLSTWMLRIVVNASLAIRRTRARTVSVDLDELLPRYDDTDHRILTASDRAGMESAWDREDLHCILRDCIDLLPDTHRTVLLLRDVHGLDTDDAAYVLGIQPGALKVRLHRSRMALRQLLQERLATAV